MSVSWSLLQVMKGAQVHFVCQVFSRPMLGSISATSSVAAALSTTVVLGLQHLRNTTMTPTCIEPNATSSKVSGTSAINHNA
jgi:hypothetical protein